ncbi:MAG TPA: selenocysteine-specific translation elongation factor [Blastocatellia bacterium]|nr:selenocysteine-specific translation elongation factor [Blastocatellia bacterium]
MKHIIVGTAGHIDHGKTALVKALTGIDADRLKEEKQRGITIDIGFADLAIGDFRFGFVDVPGHERFVKNMLAGAHGLDLVMLVVAADESVMPQTREHFDICRLLHVKSGLVALTKSDMVDDELLELARAEVEDFVSGSFLEGAPIIAVSSRTGSGIEELKEALAVLAARVEPKTTSAVPRLPVDRAFSIKGFGTVVTGTLIAGEVAVGDELEVLPAGVRARVRNVQVHGHDTERALAGQRTAINLQGLNVDQVERGSLLAPAGRLRATSMIDVRLELLISGARPLMQRARVRLHHGTAEVMARVVILQGSGFEVPGSGFGVPGSGFEPNPEPGTRNPEPQTRNPEPPTRNPERGSIQPGGSAIVQLRLEEPMTALPGDRFIIRSYSPQVTIGGGVIIDALPEKHRIRDNTARARLEQLEAANLAERLAVFVEMAGPHGTSEVEMAARTGATDDQIAATTRDLIRTARVLEVTSEPLALISGESYRTLASRVTEMLAEHHRREPLSLGLSREEVRDRIFGRVRPEIFRAVIARLAEEGKVSAERDALKLAAHRPELTDSDESAKNALEAAFKAAGLQARTLEETAAATGTKIEFARKLYTLLAAERRLVRIGDFVFHVESIDDLKSHVRARKLLNSRIDVAVFKEITGGLTRKYAIPLLEYLDRERITRRIGNEREIL